MLFTNKKIRYRAREISWRDPADVFRAAAAGTIFFITNAGASVASSPSGRRRPTPAACRQNLDHPHPSPQSRRWTYVSLGEPLFLLNVFADRVEIASPAHSAKPGTIFTPSPLSFALSALSSITPAASPAPFSGGLAGCLCYESLVFFEKIKLRPDKKLRGPLAVFIIPENYAAFDLDAKRAFLISAAPRRRLPPPPPKDRERMAPRISVGTKEKKTAKCDFTPASFSRAVGKVKKYIAAGDIFQANIARRWLTGKIAADGKEIFLRLNDINPSPHACYIKTPHGEIISSSPELLARVRGRIIETRPIAGTRPRGATPDADKKLAAGLLIDAKERAEHIMLLDLERNDLGRVSLPGSVRVSGKMFLEKYSHVTHIVSHVRGTLRKNAAPFDILRAVFPGGTITGCPKIRAIEIIDAAEPVCRGPYCGSAGWISPTGDLELNILIRTIMKTGPSAEFFAGAGIVADSRPAKEYRETAHKARALAGSLNIKIT